MGSEDIIIRILAFFGIFSLIPIVYRLLTFVWIYFLRPASLKRYLYGSKPYAVVTGASDGIGKGIAKQLYSRGFNLILHGRNEEKLKGVIEEIRSSDPTGSNRDIRYFIADASKILHDFKKILDPFRDLNITLVVNNVGGSSMMMRRLDEWPLEEALGNVSLNALFPLQLIQALLPQLRKSPGSVLVLNVGSYAGDVPPPRLPLYVASKRFMEGLSWALSVDERYYSRTNVDIVYVAVGEVCSNSVQKETSFLRPDSDTFAQSFVDKIGCGGRRISPHLSHAISQWFAKAFGDYAAQSMTAAAMWQLYHGQSKKKD